MNEPRMKALIEALEATPEAEFDLERWDCCAVGQYIRRNELCGLAVQWRPSDGGKVQLMLIDLPTGKGHYDAAAEHFQISYDQALALFEPAKYQSKVKCVVLGRLIAFYEEQRRIPATRSSTKCAAFENPSAGEG